MSRKNDETQIRILNAAWKLLETNSATEVRMSDIAKAAQLSRQAVYLHFPKRAELLIAVTHHIDEVKNIESALKLSREAATGLERLDAFIDAWGNYIPEIYSVAKALLAMKDEDEAAELAWRDRMQAVRHGCEAAVKMLKKDGNLSNHHTVKSATDILWTILSVRNFEQLTKECAMPQKTYIETVKLIARRTLLSD